MTMVSKELLKDQNTIVVAKHPRRGRGISDIASMAKHPSKTILHGSRRQSIGKRRDGSGKTFTKMTTTTAVKHPLEKHNIAAMHPLAAIKHGEGDDMAKIYT